MTGPLLTLPGKSHLHSIEVLIVQYLFEHPLQAFTANEIAERVPTNVAPDNYTSTMSRLFRIHPLIRRRKRRSQMYIPFEYWYGL